MASTLVVTIATAAAGTGPSMTIASPMARNAPEIVSARASTSRTSPTTAKSVSATRTGQRQVLWSQSTTPATDAAVATASAKTMGGRTLRIYAGLSAFRRRAVAPASPLTIQGARRRLDGKLVLLG